MEDLDRFLGEFGQKIAGQSGHKPAQVFGRYDQAFVPTYKIRDFLDKQRLDKEIGAQVGQVKKAQEAIKMGAPLRCTSSEADRFTAMQSKFWDTVHLSAILDANLPGDHLEESISLLDLTVINALRAGSRLVRAGILDGMLRFAVSHGGTERLYQNYTNTLDWIFDSPHLIRIGGTSLRELWKADPARFPPQTALSFFLESAQIRLRMSHAQVIKQGQSPQLAEYPNQAKAAVENATGEAQSLVGLPDAALEHLEISKQLKPYEQIIKEAASLALRFHHKFDRFALRAADALFTPASPNFEPVRDVVRGNIFQVRLTRLITLHHLGLREVVNIPPRYRQAMSLIDGPERAFFTSIVDTMKDYVSEAPSTAALISKEDIPSILDSGQTEKRDLPDLNGIDSLVKEIFSKTSQKSYCDIDPKSLHWGVLIPPDKIAVTFDPARVRKFNILLSYVNTVGESLDLEFRFDFPKNPFDWSFIESPTSREPEMEPMYQAAIFASHTIIAAIKARADMIYQQKQVQRAEELKTSRGTTPKKSGTPQEIQQKLKPAAQPAIVTPIKATLAEDLAVEVEKGVKNVINVPTKEDFDKKLEPLSHVDRKIVTEGIEEYNTRGVGDFKRKKKLGPDGAPRYTLAVRTTVPGGVRILVREVAGEGGVRKFEIIDIRYRKDIYRKNKM